MAAKLKIFLGMAAGVGKTYRMLGEGRAEMVSGRDVAIGYLETHGRAETAAAAEGLESIPRRTVAHGSTTVSELDLPAVLARSPELCLIDELAHTNPPGLENQKRFEDVLEVIAAGIDVFSTVNVQHLESLNDQVAELTGVRVRETLPDEVLASADEVVLIDLTPEGLIARLREGKVYPGRKVSEALGGFFKVENLQALREVALREVAEDVEAKRLVRHDTLASREERLFGTAPPAIAERLLALAELSGAAEPVVRRAWRSAQRLGAELDIVVVVAPDSVTPETRERLESLRRLASALGSTLLIEEDQDPAAAVARTARNRGTTYVLIGRQERRRGLSRLGETLESRLAHELPGVDIRIVADR